jgi:hypothetical protein
VKKVDKLAEDYIKTIWGTDITKISTEDVFKAGYIAAKREAARLVQNRLIHGDWQTLEQLMHDTDE